MKRILVPVDFSPTSKKAFRIAVDIAFKSGGSIVLYHLYTPGKKATLGSALLVSDYNKTLEENALKRLQRLKKKVLADKGEVPVSTIVGRTPVVNNILGFAEHNQITMIVMGTQGASGLKKVIVGSVAAKIIEKSDIPVLLIPEKFKWKLLEKIVFTTNFQRADKKALPVIFEMANLYGALVTFVNLHDSYDSYYGVAEDNFDTYAFSLQREFNDSRIQFKQIKTTSVVKTMEKLHEEIPYDMLVMARRELSFLNRFFQKSFTKKMAYITTQPLLVIPEK
ncbi:MAG: universal stress protein [Ginsengibacter sp.]|jgi:nucleotide-binding universal stress UspA family protein